MSIMKKFFIVLSALMLGLLSVVQGNNLKIENLTIVGSNQLSFDISWDNSWRVDPTSPPGNYDAVWLFVKRAYCSEPINWYHCEIDPNLASHSAGSPLEFYHDGYNNAGIFIQRSSAGYGAITQVTCTLTLINVPVGDFNFKVFGIEMVRIPEGPFYMGDGSTTLRWGAYNGGTYTPYLVASNNSITLDDGNMNLASNNTPYFFNGTPKVLDVNYPKGYNAIYCMKYEVTQGMMADFFNHTKEVTFNALAGFLRDGSNNFAPGVTALTWGWQNVSFQEPYRAISCPAQSTPTWRIPLFLAYFDWVGLRPMTEMEYEKICRGTNTSGPTPVAVNAVAGEYAWGTAQFRRFTPPTGAVNYGTDAETHNLTQTALQGIAVVPLDDGAGAVAQLYRVGFAAQANTSRITAAASYFGVMDMTGNAPEYCLSMYGSNPITYSNVGDGELNSSGTYNVGNWGGNGYQWQPKGGSWASKIVVGGSNANYCRPVSGMMTSDTHSMVNLQGTHARGVR
jgi:formylglycine-generating enzyme required for sulfatase activity